MIREPLDVWELLAEIRCPALIVKVSESPMLDSGVARRMAERLRNGRVIEIGNSFHHVMLDNPSALVAALSDFLAGLPWVVPRSISWRDRPAFTTWNGILAAPRRWFCFTATRPTCGGGSPSRR